MITGGSDGALRPGYEQRRDHGCIVTWRDPAGMMRTAHAPGFVVEALRELVVAIPPGSQVLSVSTPLSVLRDVVGPARAHPYEVERVLLAKVRRLDLLPSHARGRA